MTQPATDRPTMTGAALSLQRLSVSFRSGDLLVPAVRDVSLAVDSGHTVGVVGESGSGKSVTLRALMGLLPASAVVTGELRVAGESLPLTGRGVRRSRRRRLAMVFQDPLAALDPLMRVGDQVAEVPRRVFGRSRAESRGEALELLRAVRIPDPESRAAAYPHELSGGQRQRVLIAMALACRPQVLLCDEPTTALDVTVQAEILSLLRSVQERTGVSLVFVTHDLAVVAGISQSLVVLRGGTVADAGPTGALLSHPRAAYTRQLLDAVPELPRRDPRFPDPQPPGPGTDPVADVTVPPAAAGLRATDVAVTYGRGHRAVPALRGVDLLLRPASIHGLVGESGSGKTTLADVLLGAVRPDRGSVTLDGVALGHPREVATRREVQMVYQDPYSSLDPRMTVRQTLAELLRAHRIVAEDQVAARCAALLEQVALPVDVLASYPGELSGGQRQRVAIARALAVEPRVLVADEPTSALDVSVQQAILALLGRLRDALGLSVLVITHDLGVVHEICDEVTVLDGGRVVEHGDVEDVLRRPCSARTRELVDAVPRLPARGDDPQTLGGAS